ncbi:hypothetical protein PVAP13_6NG244639 [Panicum virgatum]|uniref:Uncharacterized protein n=1 Tax=Panicum virgatum TaxID=38727 RepID=A0A8T0R1W5_PANVG|nr:hypothetical protein PVAP13_6NG244639 [Panicum virgatum]
MTIGVTQLGIMSLPLLPSPVLLRRSAMSLCPPVAPRRVLPTAPDPATKSSFGVPSAQELPQHALHLCLLPCAPSFALMQCV